MGAMTSKGWYTLALVAVVFATIGANEYGYGVLAFPPGLLLSCWLMLKATDKPK